MKKTSVFVVGSALALAGGIGFVTAARARGETSSTWSCSNPARFSCAEWDQVRDSAIVAEQQAACVQLGGSVENDRCPAKNAIGSCGAPAARIVYYGPRNATQARKTCAMLGGTWR